MPEPDATAFSADAILPSPAATARLAERMATRLAPGDTLLLDGPIGAGKTHFARALIQHLQSRHGRAEDVPSPTYTLVQIYEAGALEIWHCDLYRLGHPDELAELGLEEAYERALCLIEWPDRLGAAVPPDALRLTFAPVADRPEARRIAVSSPVCWAWVETLLHD
ncbi:tRNA (adenosine(37)-N6)-threonylcarbamoyltransferase complex ATPase subunit type 1 TsaE [Maritimibacter sp. 55A14]|uniref:tRNA (adenosine(37)-N6)-threonylcarbamoyltransferase complex ATPase subunit type 1 TsaE n=1 Tax=Maritimibacter sp. 55A14 TaxID=2174844 RepID=UPI000D61E617|nr:tRNA (adenosine(37)-N6)-threonylcarbamoyltransferase complex ATPase subunit type 1 TsaE [Maritimibacter sp. 55A14]PWE33469.1 tRNA (adenosine(37)-N6)-threonylcarbamoyltransferase complex ATPase subunit type 1 TsaE [Maritimibacter sp. 55A14]